MRTGRTWVTGRSHLLKKPHHRPPEELHLEVRWKTATRTGEQFTQWRQHTTGKGGSHLGDRRGKAGKALSERIDHLPFLHAGLRSRPRQRPTPLPPLSSLSSPFSSFSTLL